MTFTQGFPEVQLFIIFKKKHAFNKVIKTKARFFIKT